MFVDRKPTRPNRYKVAPENGGEPYYIILERADEPSEEGTRLSAEMLNALLPKPQSASAGQYLRVLEVDENGNILSVEAVEIRDMKKLTIGNAVYDGSEDVDMSEAVVKTVLETLPLWSGGDY